MKRLIIFDGDYLVYRAAFVGERRSILATYNNGGSLVTLPFKNRTELWGRGKRTDDGWLGAENDFRQQNSLPLLTIEDITVEEIIEQVENESTVLHTAKAMINNIVKALKADSYLCYIGGGQKLRRLERSTLLEYKGNRKNLTKPLLKGAVEGYILDKCNGILVEDGHEADDHVVMRYFKEAKRHTSAIVVTPDKDIRGCSVKWFNPDNHTSGDSRCFGELSYDGHKVSGYGRLWFYYQWLAGDSTDNYKPNCFSDVRWGSVKAYTALKHCLNDKEALTVGKEVYKKLYPEPKTITGWRGDEIVIDYKYVASEMWDMARMVRWEGDDVSLLDVWQKFGILDE